MTSQSMTRVSAATLIQALDVCSLVRRPAFVWGSPGIGKSDIVRQLAKKAGALLIDVRASQWDAVDTRGVPYVEQNAKVGATTRWAVPSVFPSAALAAKHPLVVIFLDELNAAPPSVQAALYQLILDRRLGDYVLPDNVVIFAAGNMETDRAVTHRMSTALAGRFTHLELVVDHTAWEQWALQNDVHIAAISYLRWRQQHLHVWDPRAASKAQATPRTWEATSNIVKGIEAMGINGAVEQALIAGTVGETIGAEFTGFLKIYRRLPDPAAVIMAPDAAAVSEDAAINYALCGALAERTTKDNIDRVLKYAGRLAPEFMTMLVRSATLRKPELYQTKGFIAWAAKNGDVLGATN